MRRPLSMKRLSMLAANFLISLSKQGGKFSETQAEYAKAVVLPILLDFQKYCWQHKDDDNLFDLPLLQ